MGCWVFLWEFLLDKGTLHPWPPLFLMVAVTSHAGYEVLICRLKSLKGQSVSELMSVPGGHSHALSSWEQEGHSHHHYMGSVGLAWGPCDHAERQLQPPKEMLFKPFLMGLAETTKATGSGPASH